MLINTYKYNTFFSEVVLINVQKKCVIIVIIIIIVYICDVNDNNYTQCITQILKTFITKLTIKKS